MFQRDVYSQPNVPDPVLDSKVVLKLARLYASAQAVTGIDETGGEARTYIIDDKYIFKTQRPYRLRPSTSLKKEAFFLNQLKSEAPEVAVPRVLGYGQEGSIEYTLMTCVPGRAFRYLTVEGESRRSVLRDLGRTLKRVHSLGLAPFEESGLFPGDKSPAEVLNRIEATARRAVQRLALEKDVWELEITPEALADEVLAGLEVDGARVALHSNPGPEHVFIDPVTLEFQGIIDFGDAYVSHPAFDLRRWTTAADHAAVMEGYAPEVGETKAFQRVWHAILIGGLLATIAQWPERRPQAIESLRSFLAGK